MATTSKRRKLENSVENTLESVVSVYILPQKIQKRRFEILQRGAKAKNLPVVDKFSCDVSHVVTECDSIEQTAKALKCSSEDISQVTVATSAWLSRCIKMGRIIDVEDTDRVEPEKITLASSAPECTVQVAQYACQRRATLKHQNEQFTNPLEVLEEYAYLNDDELNSSRALAFRKASAVLKSLQQRVTSIHDVEKLPDIGGHCLKVIEDVLDNGCSNEAESIAESDWYKKMKLFTSVFGVGPATAKKWIHMGISTIAEASTHPYIIAKADARVSVGLKYFDDLNLPVQKSDALELERMIQVQLEALRPGTTVELAGGFRRGKEHGHDIDLLISHPTEGQECGILLELVQRLERCQLVIFGQLAPNTFSQHIASLDTKGTYLRSTLDHFEKWIGVLKVRSRSKQAFTTTCNEPGDGSQNSTKPSELSEVRSSFEPTDEVEGNRKQEDSTKNKFETFDAGVETSVNLDCAEKPEYLSIADVNHNPTRNVPSGPVTGLVPQMGIDWTARRVDLIVIPQSQYYYGLAGWTGNTHFNRSLRLYAQRVLGMKLTSHGLFDAKGQSIPANSEKEVFENLKLDYREPWERNC